MEIITTAGKKRKRVNIASDNVSNVKRRPYQIHDDQLPSSSGMQQEQHRELMQQEQQRELMNDEASFFNEIQTEAINSSLLERADEVINPIGNGSI